MTRVLITAAALLGLLPLAHGPASAEPLSWNGREDIGALMEAASARWDLAGCDAVVLLDDEIVEILPDGGRRTTVHTVAWFATDLVTELYSDIRVPWNSSHESLTVHALRTWRDGRWWPHAADLSPTAIVETLPGALSRADDYTTVRETVLLHDGVELPCIVETAYTVTEAPPAASIPWGFEGLRVFAREDPVVMARLTVSAPSGTPLWTASGNGMPAGLESVGDAGRRRVLWKAEFLERLPEPRPRDPACAAPYAVWSTWESWGELAERIGSALSGAGELPPALRDTLAKRTRKEPGAYAKVAEACELLNEATRAVHYDEARWRLTARPVSRTWETAYGHRLDRAALAAALFREAGAKATALFRSAGPGPIDDVPGLARFDGVRLMVDAGGVRAVYDPADGALSPGSGELVGRAVWSPGSAPPAVFPEGEGTPASFDVALSITADDEGGWSGKGRLLATSWLSPYRDMVGVNAEAEGYLEALAASVLDGADVTGHGVAVLAPDRVEAGFSFALAPGEPDELGHLRLAIGEPGGGLARRLAESVELYAETRTAPVLAPGPATETVTVTIGAGEERIVRVPESSVTETAAGLISISVERDEEEVSITRTLGLVSGTVPAERWPGLRALLLGASSRAAVTVLLKP